MESKPTSDRVLSSIRPSVGSVRYYPYATGTSSGKEDAKVEVIRLGVELSLSVAESMFLLCDDIHTMLWFCFKLWKYTIPPADPVSERMLRVMHHVYLNDIKPKNGVYKDGGNSVQWELIRTNWNDFTDGVIVLNRLVKVLRGRDRSSFDNRLLSSALEKYKQQVLTKLEDKLSPAKHVSEANGFAREATKSNISHLWKSLFHEEAGESTPEVMRTRILGDLFRPIFSKSRHNEILTPPVYSPYILGNHFSKQELREEVVRLGVELSLYVAESMFLLCDDLHSMLRFSLKLWRDVKSDLTPCSPVVERLLRVIHCVYSRNIKPKHGVYQTGGKSAQWELVSTTLVNFDAGIRDLHKLFSSLEVRGTWASGRACTSSVEDALKKVEEKLRCAKDVSEANGFSRDAMESKIFDLWKSLFDKETEEQWTLKVMRDEIVADLFQPLYKEELVFRF